MDAVRKAVIGVALAAFAACFGWALSTLFLSRPVIQGAMWLPFFLGIFPLVFFVISGGRGVRSWRPGRVEFSYSQLRAHLPLGVLIVGMALFLACWLLAMSAFRTLSDGGPATVNGLFYADNHGSYTPITEARYHELQLAEQRVFTAVPAAFYLAGAIFLSWFVRRSTARSAYAADSVAERERATGAG